MKPITAAILLALSSTASALTPFTISDIRIDGLERISDGTVLTYLPVEKGDQLNLSRARQAIRALYRTGFFENVKLDRQDDILVITVEERPAISKLTVTGNKDIKSEELLKGLTNIGIAEGEVFDRLQLDRVTQELTKQYYNRGKYNVKITPSVNTLDRNRVELTLVIAEGKASKIKHLNIVGNKAFTDEEITETFEAKTTNWLSWYRRDDQYSREKLSGDLEKLRSFYLDRGYVDVDVQSTQVSISPDRRNIYITANVTEGDVYSVGEIKLTGEFIVDEAILRQFIFPVKGEIFSRKKLEQTSEAIKAVLANVGYAFTEVREIPNIDRDQKIVDLTFLVEPGKRTYVRRINFVGNAKTRDEVLRREMRQFEGGWYSKASIDRSKIRLQRLGFFSDVKIDTQPVAGTDDKIDVKITVEERTSGSFQSGVGYSANSGIVTSLSLSQDNFLGQGNRVGFVVNRNDFFQRFDVSYFNPYWTDDGVSRGFNVSYRTLDQGQNNLATYLLDTTTFSMIYSIPVTETDRVNVSFGIDRNKITTDNPLIDSFETLGTPYEFVLQLGDDRSFNALRASLSWARDTRNRFVFPNDGGFQQIGLNVTLPPSDLRYYKFLYQLQQYRPITPKWILFGNLEVGYGNSYGGRFDSLPFFENFYSGGVRSVRGFRDNTLGPRLVTNCVDRRTPADCPLLPVGGALNLLANLELIIPTPEKTADNFRLSAFIDAGNVFVDLDSFSAKDVRYAAGLSVQWLAPISPQPIQINLAWPLNSKEGDERDGPLQFSFGTNF